MAEIIRIATFYISLIFELLRYTYEKYTRKLYANYPARSLQNKIVLVTGANSGIGKATAFEMVKRGATVIMACRNPTFGENAVKDIRRRTQAGKMVHALF